MRKTKFFSKQRFQSGATSRNSKQRFPVWDFVLAGVFVVIFAVAGGAVYDAVYGVSRTVDHPRTSLTVEILDSSTDGRFGESVSAHIEALSDEQLDIEVVNHERMRFNQRLKSFVIARQENVQQVQELTRRLGLNPDDIVVRPLEDDRRGLQASIVLADDFSLTELTETENKEK